MHDLVIASILCVATFTGLYVACYLLIDCWPGKKDDKFDEAMKQVPDLFDSRDN